MNSLKLRPRAVRTLVLFSFMTFSVALFAFRLFQLQVVQYAQWAERSKKNHMTKRTLEMRRGKITDRNNVELAISIETYSVFIYTRELKSPEDAATLLSTILPMTKEEILDKIADRKGYIQIYKNLERNQAVKIMQMEIPGINLEENYRRVYPQNFLASNILGFTGTDGLGLEGLELTCDNLLKGYPGLAVYDDLSIEGTDGGSMRIIRPPMGGSNIVLTIDSLIQHILETELQKICDKYEPVDATAIVMDPGTGEILGMACLPNYDLNDFARFPADSRRNRPIVDIFEPGSCIKIFAMAAALEYRKVGPGSRFYCRGYGEVSGRRVKCTGRHGLTDIDSAIALSCNSAMVQISQLIEPHQLYRTYRQAGFGESTGIDFPGESGGILKPPSKWSGFTATSLCIGQEMAVTALQLVRAFSAIANDGRLLNPRLIRQIVTPTGETIPASEKKQARQIMNPKTAKKLRQMLMGVVEGGTGKQAILNDYTVGGKTSTAQKANPKGGYFNDKVVVSFIGMAPAIEPRIVLLVALNEPKGDEKTLYGGKIAAPVFASIADRILKYLKVPPDKKLSLAVSADPDKIQTPHSSPNSQKPEPIRNGSVTSDDTTSRRVNQGIIDKPTDVSAVNLYASASDRINLNTLPIQADTAHINKIILPDLRGKTLKEASQIVRALGIKAVFEGNGIAVEQNPRPGITLPDSYIVTVKFSPKSGF